MKALAAACSALLLMTAAASQAYAWGGARGAYGGAAFRGPGGGGAVRGPGGNWAARGPGGNIAYGHSYGYHGGAYGYHGGTYYGGGVYHGAYYGAGAVAAGVAVGAAATASANAAHPYYYYPHPIITRRPISAGTRTRVSQAGFPSNPSWFQDTLARHKALCRNRERLSWRLSRAG